MSVQGTIRLDNDWLTGSICFFLAKTAVDNPLLLILEYLRPAHF